MNKKLFLSIACLLTLIAVSCGGNTSSSSASLSESLSVSQSESISEPHSESKSETVSETQSEISSEASSEVSSSISETKTYSITFDNQGHGDKVDSLLNQLEMPASLPELKADGYEFKGWYLDSSCTKEVVYSVALEKDVTLYAKWEKTIIQVSFNASYGINIDPIEVEDSLPTLPILDVDGGSFAGWYYDEDYSKLASKGDKITQSTTLYAKFNDCITKKEATNAIEINTVEDFLAFRTSGSNNNNYILNADIDLKDVELKSSTCVFSGVFDGNGHTIKNASYSNAGAKTGVLLAKIDGGQVHNLHFFSCEISGSNESLAILAGEINNGGLVSNIEFSACAIDSTGNYAGLVFARSEGSLGKEVIMDRITVKNNSQVACGQYGGVITGDNTANITLKNSHIVGKLLRSSNNYGLLLGRTRDDSQIYRVYNSLVDVSFDGKLGTSTGLISQGKNKVLTLAKNMVVLESNCSIAGANGVLVSENIVYKKGVNSTYSGATIKEEAALNNEFYKSFFDSFDSYWEEEEDHIKLIGSSANVASSDDVVTKIDISTTLATLRFKKGEEFNSSGLIVSAYYESGVITPLDASEYEIDASKYNKDVKGNYEITITCLSNANLKQTYEVSVVEQLGFRVDDQFAEHILKQDSTFSKTNLVVYGIWSDGKEERLSTSEYNVDSIDTSTLGQKEVNITSSTFEAQKYQVTVIDGVSPEVVDNKISVTVDSQFDGVEGTTFTSINHALDAIRIWNLNSDVKKVIKVKNGTYFEKLNINIPNVILVGEDNNLTRIEYDAVESTVNPLNNSQYGMKCATIQVTAEGFEAHNIGIINTFDYKNNQYNAEFADVKESSPQGIALSLDGDKFILNNCHIYGNQDTIYLKSGRTYFKGGLIEGNIDFICGEAKGIAYFDQVEIRAIAKSDNSKDLSNNGYVSAMKGKTDTKPNYGIVFNECNFTSESTLPAGCMSLGRPWEEKATIAYISCSFSKAYSKNAYTGSGKSRWANMSSNSPVNADFVEYNSTGEGAITSEVAGGKILTEDEAKEYTLSNTFAKQNGKVTWSSEFVPEIIDYTL